MSCGVIVTSASRGTTRARMCSRSRESFLLALSATRHALRHVWRVANPDAPIVAFLGFVSIAVAASTRITFVIQRRFNARSGTRRRAARSSSSSLADAGRRRSTTIACDLALFVSYFRSTMLSRRSDRHSVRFGRRRTGLLRFFSSIVAIALLRFRLIGAVTLDPLSDLAFHTSIW